MYQFTNGGVIDLQNTLVKLQHSQNAPSLIKVTLLEMVTLVKLLQPLNALLPILVTLSGIVTLIKLSQW